MSSSPPNSLPPPLGINYDSDDDMNVDSDSDQPRVQDMDADGESVDEDSSPDINHHHIASHNHHEIHMAPQSVCSTILRHFWFNYTQLYISFLSSYAI